MIFTETREGRRFVGEVPPGQPLVAALRQLCDSYRIDSGWFDCAGVVRDAIIRPLAESGEYGEPMAVSGPALVAALKVAVSQKSGARDLEARVILSSPAGTVAGRLEEAVSGSVELTAQTFDDITMRRHLDYDSGLWRWLDVAVNVVTADEPTRSGRSAMEALPSRLLEPEELPSLKVGDVLAHPALGDCTVTAVHDSDRVSIQMENGKIAQLHLGVLSLSKSGTRAGRAVYTVHVRRRNA